MKLIRIEFGRCPGPNHHGGPYPRGTITHGAMLVRVAALVPMWRLFRYNKEGGWWFVQISFPLRPRSTIRHSGRIWRLRWPWKKDEAR